MDEGDQELEAFVQGTFLSLETPTVPTLQKTGAPPVVYRFLAWHRESAWLGTCQARSRAEVNCRGATTFSSISV